MNEQIEGGAKLLHRLLDNGFDASGAAWIKLTDEPRWHLYVVTPIIESLGPIAAYRQMGDTLGDMDPIKTYPSGCIDAFALKLIGPGEQLAQGVLSLYRHFPNSISPTWLYSMLGDAYLDLAYVYPPSLFQPQAQPAAS